MSFFRDSSAASFGVLKMKIITRLKGGLGNQLFIYAFARALRARVGAELLFDLQSGFLRDRFQQRYWLAPFLVTVAAANTWESYVGGCGRIRRKIAQYTSVHRPLTRRGYVQEPDKCFCSEIANLNRDGTVYIDGHWESFRYFEDYESLLRAELTMQVPADRENERTAESIDSCDAIMVHARRLKGVPNAPGAKPDELHPQLSLDYYHRAVELISGRCRDPRIFCFSDYPAWFVEHFRPPMPVTYVTHNGAGGDATSWKDLWLMRRCRHFVIANSTFSWWGAWLAENASKMVVYPDPRGLVWRRNRDMMPWNWIGVA